MKELYLGLDFGTSYIKATVVDENNDIVFKCREKSSVLNPKPGFYEIDPIRTWWKRFLKICETLEKNNMLKRIRCVCISSVCGTFVPVDGKLNPTYNAILYGIDRRASKQIDNLNGIYHEEYLRQTLGGRFDSHSIIPKILWFKENEKQLYGKTRWFLESTNFITAKLTGEVAWDYPTASGSKLVDMRRKEYTNILGDLNLLEKIPPLKWPIEQLGMVSKKAAEDTGLTEGTQIMVGSCDINSEMIAANVFHPGDMLVVLGSTTSMVLIIQEYSYLENFIISFGVKDGTYKIGGATASGARFLKWVERVFRIPKGERAKDEISGILILPHIDGARLPFNNSKAKVVIWGMDCQTSSSKILRAAKEALGYEIAVIMDILKKEGKYDISSITLTGGLTGDDELIQIIANVLGRELKITPHENDASYGAATIANMKDKLFDFRKGSARYKLIKPNRKEHYIYQKYVNMYRSLYERTLLSCE